MFVSHCMTWECGASAWEPDSMWFALIRFSDSLFLLPLPHLVVPFPPANNYTFIILFPQSPFYFHVLRKHHTYLHIKLKGFRLIYFIVCVWLPTCVCVPWACFVLTVFKRWYKVFQNWSFGWLWTKCVLEAESGASIRSTSALNSWEVHNPYI